MENQSTAKIREIFTSIQGEGPYMGEKHAFVRFCRCNLNCEFCDTDFDIKKADEYDIRPSAAKELIKNLPPHFTVIKNDDR